jgi:hypothetical protein
MASEYSMPTTGNEDEDRRRLERFALHTERMQKNICPNGCEEMTWDDPHNRHCEKCGFAGFSTEPYDFKAGNA